MNRRVLVIEDNPSDARLIQEMITRTEGDGVELQCADRLSNGLSQLSSGEVDLVLLDLSLPDSQGLDTFYRVKAHAPQAPIVILSGLDDEELAIEAIHEGAQDYLVKGQVDSNLVGRSIRYAIERKQIEKALWESERKYKELAESITDMFFAMNGELSFTYWNRACEELMGISAKDALRKHLYDLFPNVEATRKAEKSFLKVLRTKQPQHFVSEYQLGTKDFSFEISAYPTNGGLSVFVKDVTERKQMENELLKMQKLESIGILAGGIAHDFNNILTSILGNITLAKGDAEPGGKVFDRLLDAEKASVRAKDLTQQLLTFSKGGAPVKRITTIAELIKDSATFASRGSKTKCELFLPDDLWPVEVDEGQMSQVISNLVINADEAMPEGGVVKIRAQNTFIRPRGALRLRAGKYVEVTIEDDGVGMSKKHLQRIFEPYFTTKQKGSGLGLATTYSIIKNHGGHISAKSKLGVGTTFYIYLPASKKPIPAKKKLVRETSLAGKSRILVMDDEEMIRELLNNMLSVIGYQVELSRDGTEAVERYGKAKESGQPFDVVILDLTVPGGMGGKEAIKHLLEVDPNVKAVVSSGYSTDPIMADFREYGFSAVVPKPYSVSQLEKTLRSMLKEKS